MAAIKITKKNSKMLSYAVIIAFLASYILSADAIRCHQCNSHLEEDCIKLRLVTPRAPIDMQYLKDCEGADAFCRKTVVSIEVTGEKRIVRSCGKLDTHLAERKNSCFDADNEGFKQTICACFDDGCNGASLSIGSGAVVFVTTGLCVLLAALLRRSV